MANWSLWQGDEEVNKRIERKYKLPNISVWKQIFLRGLKKNFNLLRHEAPAHRKLGYSRGERARQDIRWQNIKQRLLK